MSLEKDKIIRIAFWISVVFLIISLFAQVIATYYIFLTAPALNMANWQYYVLIFIPLPLLLSTLVGFYVTSQGKPFTAFYAIVIGALSTIFLLPWVIGNIEPFVLLIVLPLTIFAVYILPDKPLRRVVFLLIGTGIFSLIADAWVPWRRMIDTVDALPAEQIAIGLIVIILAFFIRPHLKNFNIRTKITLPFAIVPVLIIGGFSLLLNNSLRNQFQEQVELNMQADVDALSTELILELADVEADVRYLGQSEALATYLALLESEESAQVVQDARSNLKQEFLNFAQARQIYAQVRYIDAAGQEIVRINTTNLGHSVSVFDSSLSNRARRYYFEETIDLNENEVFISPLNLNVEKGEIEMPYQPVIWYGTPIIHHGETKGIVIINVMAEKILQQLDSADTSHFLVDVDGYYLYHPEDAKRWGRDLQNGITLFTENQTLTLPLLNQGAGVIQDDVNFYAYQPVTLANEQSPRWYLIESVANESVVAQVRSAYALIRTISSIIILIAPAIGLLISQLVAAPILGLTKSAEQIAAGNMDVDLKIGGNDELAMLASTFTMMAQRLGKQVGGLEARATQRTQELMLTADISVRIGRLRDLDQLLQEAVTLIRDYFDLYYVQVYLSDSQNKLLVLQAGTGDVGQQLQQRHFQLPFRPDSLNGLAATEKQAVIVPDTRTSTQFRPNPLLPETHSEAAVPMLVLDQVVGVLDLQSREPFAFSEENRLVFEILAGQLATAVNNVRLYQEAERAREIVEMQAGLTVVQAWDDYLDGIRNRKSIGYRYTPNDMQPLETAVNDTESSTDKMPISIAGENIGSLSITMQDDVPLSEADEELVAVVASQVAQRIDNLRLLSEAERFRLEAEDVVRRTVRASWQDYRMETSVHGYQYDQKQVQLLDDLSEDEFASTVSIPIDIRGEEIARLFLEGVNEEDENAHHLTRAIADQLGAHIENLRLTDQTRMALAESERQGEELALINRVVSQVAASLDLQESLEVVAAELARAINVEQIGITLLNEAKTEATVVAEYFGDSQYEKALGVIFKLEENPLTQQVIDTRRPVVIPDAQHNPLTASIHDVMHARGTQTLIILPMVSGNEVIGTVGIDLLEANQVLTAEQMWVAETIIYQAATAVQNARLFTEANKRAEELALINTISEMARSQLNTSDMLIAVGTMLQEAFDAESIYFAFYDKQAERLTFPYFFSKEEGIHEVAPRKMEEGGLTGQIVEARTSMLRLWETKASEAVAAAEGAQLVGSGRLVNSYLGVPMIVGEEVIGVIGTSSYREVRTYNEQDQRLMETLAGTIGVAIQNARQFQATQRRAEREALINTISQRIQAAPTVESALQTAVSELGEALKLKKAFIELSTDKNEAVQEPEVQFEGNATPNSISRRPS
ncbi:MAG: GAF domain-containing protein [Anaerolineales bacterium]|nr:GAF domain-containing protein [Anaerolineales bacterium]